MFENNKVRGNFRQAYTLTVIHAGSSTLTVKQGMTCKHEVENIRLSCVNGNKGDNMSSYNQKLDKAYGL